MDCNVLNRRGNSFIEIIAAVALILILLSVVMGGYKVRTAKARLEATIAEMMSLAHASEDFYKAKGYWPVSPADLAGTFMYASISSSPLGGVYQINGWDNSVSVSTAVPSGLAEKYYQGSLLEISSGASNDTITITRCLPNEFSGRLEYEKKYIN